MLYENNEMCAVKLDMNNPAKKLDMTKAYDRVEWSFLEKIMLKFGFEEQWVQLIMECVSVGYTVRFNNTEIKEFVPSRGLRKGDPLSPYIFLLCSEGLSSLLSHEHEIGGLDRVKVCRNAQPIPHLLFMDDSLILMKADHHNTRNLKRILE